LLVRFRAGFSVRVNEMSLSYCQVAAAGAETLLSASHAWSLTEAHSIFFAGWEWPPFVVMPLVVAASFYGVGIFRRLRRTATRRAFAWPIVWFALGWISLVIALDSPLHELGEQLFWVHMTQHEILILVAAPLLVIGRPIAAFLWAFTPRWRLRLATCEAATLCATR